METIKVKSYSEIPRGFTGIAEYADGKKEWYLNGELHRVDGPAIERADGTKTWCFNGKRHRVDGPAWERADGSKEWWLNGKHFTQEKWKAEVSKLNLKVKKLTVDETLPPNFTGIAEYADGRKDWYLDGEIHRVDGPAIESADGTKQWWLNYTHVFTLEPIGDYIVIEDGLPSTMEWLDKPVSTLKVLTAEGIKYIPNLPGI